MRKVLVGIIPNPYTERRCGNGKPKEKYTDEVLRYGRRKAVSYTHLDVYKRQLLKNAPIVLLDEATASLDVENETKVQGALSRLLAGKTVLVIAHRMRTVAGADHIVVLKDGCVAEQGTPQALMSQGSLFRHMVELQNQSAQWQLG